ncbi:MAG: hypothetical protein EOM24_04175 [Chloroflexia bacterium]|nr:hypothetical protein [Chloroflexia bacterium]
MGPEVVIDGEYTNGRYAILALDAAWIGDAYRVVWKVGEKITVADFDRDGKLLGSPRIVVEDQGLSHAHLAYDPISGSHLLVYVNSVYVDYYMRNQLIGLRFTDRKAEPTKHVLATESFTTKPTFPQVAYHPTARAWLVSWGDWSFDNEKKQRGVLVGPDGAKLTDIPQIDFAWGSPPSNAQGGSVACPAISSVPILELPFEEFPGATSFADRSGYGSTSSCSGGNCPVAGVSGAPGAPGSVFALHFDGVNQGLDVTAGSRAPHPNEVSLAFWFRTTQVSDHTGEPSQATNVLVSHNEFSIGIRDGTLDVSALNNMRRILGTSIVNDGAWHFATVTMNSDLLGLYVDGELQRDPVQGFELPPQAMNLRLGYPHQYGSFFRGAIDHLQVFPTALSKEAVKSLYANESQSYCVVSVPAARSLNYASLRLDRNILHGGVITATAGLSLTVDGDTPSSLISSHPNGARLRGENGATTVIIGGHAEDATSAVALVEVSVNGGPFEPADGRGSWTYALIVPEGVHRVVTRATDAAGNVETPGSGITVYVDSTAPTGNFDAALSSAPQRPVRTADGQWSISLSGSLSDPASGGLPGSGIDRASLKVQLQGAGTDLGAAGAGYQPATLVNRMNWAANYLLPAELGDPSGVFTATLSAADLVGNPLELVQARITVDAAAPTISLDPALFATPPLITQTLNVRGQAHDGAGVTQLEAVLTPIEQVVALSGTVTLLPFDEPAGAQYFADRSPSRNDARCGSGGCPTAGEAGRIDGALSFTRTASLQVEQPQNLSFPISQSVTLQAWLRTDDSLPVQYLVDLKGSSGASLVGLLLLKGEPALQVGVGGLLLFGPTAVNDDQWHHLVGVVDRAAGQATLYLDGTPVATAPLDPSLGDLGGGKLSLGLEYNGLLDQVAIIAAALNPAQVQALYATAATPRLPVTLSSTSPTSPTWSLAVPSGLEGQYQIDMYGEDSLGNRALAANRGRFLIDTTPPRLQASARATGQSFVDEHGTRHVKVQYNYAATDRHLDEPSFSGPCDAVADRSFADMEAVAALFPDLTVRDGLAVSCHRWEPVDAALSTVTACDFYGHCVSREVSIEGRAMLAASPAEETQALIVAPTEGQIVAADSTLHVRVASSTSSAQDQVALELDGAPVATLTPGAGTTVTSVELAAPPEGIHTLTAHIVGQSQPISVSFQVDRAAPSVTLADDTITSEDRMAPGSSIFSLSGTASDSLGLAAVQVSINNEPFADATLRPDGNWSTARWFGWNAEGKSFSITVRALDLAGRQTEISRDVNVAIPPLPTVHTNIDSGPPATSASSTASFAFSGTAQSGHTLTGFSCRLNDGQFTPCSSPQHYHGLPQGEHRFEVFAVDSSGTTDSTPAVYHWRVDGQRIYLPMIIK